MDEKLRKDFDRFKNLSYEDFKTLATDDSLSAYQKIGFPDSYRDGKEEAIFEDVFKKLDLGYSMPDSIMLDIGIGCSGLAKLIIDFTRERQMKLLAVDSAEMLRLLPESTHVEKYEGYFPDQTARLFNDYAEKVDYIICYSIFHYVFYNTCSFRFIDMAVSLLKPGGKLLIADLPNISKRRRFFSSETGVVFHKQFTNTNTLPDINHLELEPAQMDDGVLFGIMQRYRNFGFETYLLPQPGNLPMANRREDLLIVRN